MEWRTWPDARSFLDDCEDSLAASPVWNQVPLGIARSLVIDPSRFTAPRLAGVYGPTGFRGAVFQTPPWSVALSRMSLADAAFAGRRWAETFPDLRDAWGEEHEITAFLGAAAATLGATDMALEQGMGLYELRGVADVPRPNGYRRRLEPGDESWLQGWLHAFRDEATPHDPFPAPDQALRAIARGAGHVWIDGGPVAWAQFGRDVGSFVSVGPVYTPPESRGRGYATALVAEMSRMALAEGRQGCTLFTDLANPTSNRIYERIGYRMLGTMRRYRLTVPGS